MAAPLRSFDFAGNETLDSFFRRQRRRIRGEERKAEDYEWFLTVKGQKPAQVALPGIPTAVTKEKA